MILMDNMVGISVGGCRALFVHYFASVFSLVVVGGLYIKAKVLK